MSTLQNGNEISYGSVNVYFFLAILYGMILSSKKETFYQNVFYDFENINEENLTAIINFHRNHSALNSNRNISFIS